MKAPMTKKKEPTMQTNVELEIKKLELEIKKLQLEAQVRGQVREQDIAPARTVARQPSVKVSQFDIKKLIKDKLIAERKTCPKCGFEKHATEFGFRIHRGTTPRIQSWCTECRGKEDFRAYRRRD